MERSTNEKGKTFKLFSKLEKSFPPFARLSYHAHKGEFYENNYLLNELLFVVIYFSM